MKVNDTLVKDFLVVYSCFYREAFFDVKKHYIMKETTYQPMIEIGAQPL